MLDPISNGQEAKTGESIDLSAFEVTAEVQGETQEEIQIDPRFSNLDKKEALIRTLQSRVDSLTAEHSKLKPEYEKLTKVAEIINMAATDEKALIALVEKLKPGFIPKKDAYSYMQEELSKEFGTDFTPNPDEIKIKGTKSWLYDKRAEELYSDYRSNNMVSLDSYLQQKQQSEIEKQNKLQEELNSIKQEYGVDDTGLQEFIKFASSIKLKDMYKIFSFSKNKKGVSSVAGIPGASKINNPTIARIDKLFG